MRIKLFLLLLLAYALPALAQQAALNGTVVDGYTGQPVEGAIVMLTDRNVSASTDTDGHFALNGLSAGKDVLIVAAYGYNEFALQVNLPGGRVTDLPVLKLTPDNLNDIYYTDQEDMLFDQAVLDDEESTSQTIGSLTGASDNVYYNAANYDFNVMRFRIRGYDSEYNTTYINGINLNDMARGRFSYSSLGGLNRAFRNRTTTIGINSSTYGFGNIGGSANINTLANSYAPGFYGSVAYTNSNYMMRAMLLNSTGINRNGWGLTVGAIARYAPEGVIPGTFYNSAGIFMSLQKEFNDRHSLSLTAYGSPTQRATSSATYLEAYDLADNNLYNPNWGWQDGKKRSSKIVETFDPTILLNWIWKPRSGTSLNTGIAVRSVNYSTSALNWYNAADPRPDYYRYLPSYYKDDQEAYDLYTSLWKDESFRQLDWDGLYQANYLNAAQGKGSTYIQEARHSNQFNFILSSTLNHRINSSMSLQGGVSFNYTRASYFKTMRDLLGGEYWTDIDQFSERDYPDNPELAQNELRNPNRKIYEGDRFGYDYDIYALRANAWLQNIITLPRWDIHYGMSMTYTQFYRDGNMQNGRAPSNSLGKGETHRFDDAQIKAGATFKIDGRNFITLNAEYGTMAPLFEYAYISPRIKDTAIDGLASQRIATADLTYSWNYRRLRGSIGGFYTDMRDLTERTSYYDDQYSTFMNYVLKGVNRVYKGVELGVAYKITGSLTASLAGTVASYRYKNNPMGTRSYENGMMPDVTTHTYLKNYHVGGTPQTAVNLGLDWAAPRQWFFNINGSWMGNAYVNQSPIRHESIDDLWTAYPDQAQLAAAIDELTNEDKLNNAFVLNASIGKVVYINRKLSLNFNLNVDNILNNRDIMTYGYQQGRFDYTNFSRMKYPNRYYFAQGIKVFFNVGIRF